jgi:hypothetical protein
MVNEVEMQRVRGADDLKIEHNLAKLLVRLLRVLVSKLVVCHANTSANGDSFKEKQNICSKFYIVISQQGNFNHVANLASAPDIHRSD